MNSIGANVRIASSAILGKNVTICDGVVIEDNVEIGEGCYIDYNAIIKKNVRIGKNSFVGAQCILGEVLHDFFDGFTNKEHPLLIGDNAILRSGSIFYGDTTIGNCFQTGHRVTVREKAKIGNHVNLGTLSDIQGTCEIGNYVHMHSNVHIGMKTTLKDYVWVFPYVVFTNDPTPPSNVLLGGIAEEFSVICTGSIVLPGVRIGKDALVGAGTNVTKNVEPETIVVGNPGKVIGKVQKIKNDQGKSVYPWRHSFDRGMPWQGRDYDTYIQTKR